MILLPGPRSGTVTAPASKSQAHRLFLAAALGNTPCRIVCPAPGQDMLATVACLNALGAVLREAAPGLWHIAPIRTVPKHWLSLPCGQSGTTLRFLLPLVGALGAEAKLLLEGRLPQRPIQPLAEALRVHGMNIEARGRSIVCRGQLRPGDYTLPGNISSQFISGLLLALPLIEGTSTLTVTGEIVSPGYIALTEQTLARAGIQYTQDNNIFHISGTQHYRLPAENKVEGDWSSAAFFLCMGALSSPGITVRGLDAASAQGDRALTDVLRRMGAEVTETADGITVRRGTLRAIEIDAEPIPDLIPPLAVLAALAKGESRFRNVGRLRDKESDRLAAIVSLLTGLGVSASVEGRDLLVRGQPVLSGGRVDSFRDHRIAMSAALAATGSRDPIELSDSECVYKSYPRFWEDFQSLKGAAL